MLAWSTGCPARCRSTRSSSTGSPTSWTSFVRRTRFRLRKAEERAHILRALLKALDAMDEVIALIRASATVEVARDGLDGTAGHRRDPGPRHPRDAAAPPRRPGAAADHRRVRRAHAAHRGLQRHPRPARAQRQIVGDELREIVERYGDDRKTQILPFEGDMTAEDLIPSRTSSSPSPAAGTPSAPAPTSTGPSAAAAGVRGEVARGRRRRALLHDDDPPLLLFFTNLAGSTAPRGTNCPRAAGRRGQHVANLLAFQPGERIVAVLDIEDYEQARTSCSPPAAGSSRRPGCPSTTRTAPAGSSPSTCARTRPPRRRGGRRRTVRRDPRRRGRGPVPRLAQGHERPLRGDRREPAPMGRAPSGVTGMKFRGEDELLAMAVPATTSSSSSSPSSATPSAPRSGSTASRAAGAGHQGRQAHRERGDLVGASRLQDDEVLVVMQAGRVVRSRVDEVPAKGRDTMGVTFARPETETASSPSPGTPSASSTRRWRPRRSPTPRRKPPTTRCSTPPGPRRPGGRRRCRRGAERWSTCGGTGERPCGGRGRWRTVVRGSAERARHRR